MQADRSRTPEQNLAHDLGLLEADLERIVRHERARDRAERLVGLARKLSTGTARTCLSCTGHGAELDAILAEIDAPIGGGA